MRNPNPTHSLRIAAVAAIFAIALAGCANSEKAVIPAGTMLVATLNEPLSTDYHHAGDSFLATVREPLEVDDKTVIAAGTTVRGEITNVNAGTADGTPPSLTLLCSEIALASGHMLTIATSPVVIEGTPLAAADPAVSADPTESPGPAGSSDPAPAGESASSAAAAPGAIPTQPVAGEMTTTVPAGQLLLSAGHEIRIEIVAPAEVVIVAS